VISTDIRSVESVWSESHQFDCDRHRNRTGQARPVRRRWRQDGPDRPNGSSILRPGRHVSTVQSGLVRAPSGGWTPRPRRASFDPCRSGGCRRAGVGRTQRRLRWPRGDEGVGASFTGYAVTDIGVPDPQCGRTLRARDDDPSLFRPSLGQEDRSAPVRVCCVRSACLLGRERVIALLTLDLLALVSAPDPQAGRAAGAEGDEVRWDVIQRRSSRVPQDRRSSSPWSIVIPVWKSTASLHPSILPCLFAVFKRRNPVREPISGLLGASARRGWKTGSIGASSRANVEKSGHAESIWSCGKRLQTGRSACRPLFRAACLARRTTGPSQRSPCHSGIAIGTARPGLWSPHRSQKSFRPRVLLLIQRYCP